MIEIINLEDLAKFLVAAKRNTYAGDGKKLDNPQRPDFKELEHTIGDWNYRDSYSGFFMAPGQEVVRFKGQPVWTMAYSGGMLPEYRGNINFARSTFAFLKSALLEVDETKPFRGPEVFSVKEGWKYRSLYTGNITDFSGSEEIRHKDKKVFSQRFIGGLIIPKQFP